MKRRSKQLPRFWFVSDGLTCGTACMYRGETLPDDTEKQHDVLFRSTRRPSGRFRLPARCCYGNIRKVCHTGMAEAVGLIHAVW